MDESAVLRLELEGSVYVIKGAYHLLGKLAQVVASLVKYAAEHKQPGSMSYKDLSKVSEGQPVGFEIPVRDSMNRFIFKDADGHDLNPRTYNELTESERAAIEPLLNNEKNAFKETEEIEKSTYKVDGKKLGEKVSVNTERGRVSIIPSEFSENMQLLGIRYCVLPDAKPYDNYFPFAVASQDSTKAAMYAKRSQERENTRCEIEYDRHIEMADKERELADACDPLDREQIGSHLKNAEIHEEIAAAYKKTLSEGQEALNNENQRSIEEMYVDNPTVMKDPDRAMSLAKSGLLSEEISIQEAFTPQRIVEQYPVSRKFIYATEGEGVRIERDFILELDTPGYSTYTVMDKNGKQISYLSDKNKSDEEWQKDVEKMLDIAGLKDAESIIRGTDEKSIEAHFSKPAAAHFRETDNTKGISRAEREENLREVNFNKATVRLESIDIIGDDSKHLSVRLPDDSGYITFSARDAILSEDKKSISFDKEKSYKFTNARTKVVSDVKGIDIPNIFTRALNTAASKTKTVARTGRTL